MFRKYLCMKCAFLAINPKMLPTTAKKTIVASFLFDDGDGITSAKAIKSFGIGVFLNAVDVFIKADSTQHSSIYYNGKRILLPRIASKDGVMVAIFN